MTFIEPNIDVAFLVLRLALAAIFLAHGPAKLQKSQQMASGMGMTAGQVMGIGALEVLGALSMILGVYMQVGAIFLIVVMLGAIYLKTQRWNKGFTGDSGWELDFAILAAAVAVLLGAPATYSLF